MTVPPPPAPADVLGAIDPATALPDQAAAYEQELAEWRRDGIQSVDRHLLDFERFSPDARPAVRRRALTNSYLSLFAPPEADLADPITRASLRAQLAERDLGGAGRDDDDAFFDALQIKAQDRSLQTRFREQVVRKASLNALSGAPDTDLYRHLREQESAPGYQSEALPDYLRLWGAARAEQIERLGPVLPEVQALWKSFTAPAGEGTPDIRTQAIGIYRRLDPDGRQILLANLRLLADSLPAERKAALWDNFLLGAERGVGGMVEKIGTTALEYLIAEGGKLGGAIGEDPELHEERAEDIREARLEQEFADDIATIRNEHYDPIPVLLDPERYPWGSAVEQGFYALPTAGAYMGAAAIPGVGLPAVFLAGEREVRDTLRRRWVAEGVDPTRASDVAHTVAPIAAVPYALLERLGAQGLLGKVPTLNKLLRTAGNRTTTIVGRGAARVAGLSVFETSIETAQDFLTELSQQAADALTTDLPGPDWHAYLSQLPGRTVSTYVALFPLIVLGAAGGVKSDAQAQHIASLDETTLLAAGAAPADIAALRSAQQTGPSDLLAAAQGLIERADPTSDLAQVNQGIREAEQEAARERIDQAIGTGVLPRFDVREDQIDVIHPTTGELLGSADTPQDALGIADARLHSNDLQDAARVRFLANLLTASQASARLTSGAVESVEASPGLALDLGQVSRRSTADAARVASQLAAREHLETGSSALTDLILGESSPIFRDGQRSAITKLYAGASITTVFHEEWHALWGAAKARGSLTDADALAVLRSVDAAIAKSAARFKGPDASRAPKPFLRPDFDTLDPDLQATALDEAIAELGEAEILRTRKGTGARTSQLPAGLISEGITAAAQLHPEAAGRFRAFLRAVRDFFGLAFNRAAAITRGIKSGEIDANAYNSFLEALLGQSEQATHDQAAAREFVDMAAAPADDSNPFSIGPAKLARHAELEARKDSLTPEERAEAERIVEEAAMAAGLEKLHHGSRRGVISEFKEGSWFTDNRDAASELGAVTTVFLNASEFLNIEGRDSVGVENLVGILNQIDAGDAASSIDDSLIEAQKEEDPDPQNARWYLDTASGSKSQAAWVTRILREKFKGVRFEDWGMEEFDDYFTSYLVFDPTQIKSAEPFTGVPLAQRFDSTRPEISFSIGQPVPLSPPPSFALGNAEMVSVLTGDVLGRLRAPEARLPILRGIADRLAVLRSDSTLAGGSLATTTGTPRVDWRTKGQLEKEARSFRSQRLSELEADIWRPFAHLLSDESLTQLKSQPVHSYLASTRGHLHGQLLSPAAWRRRHPGDPLPSEYEGAGTVSPTVFGGELQIDKAAQALFEEGMLPEPTGDALWDALRGEAATVANAKEQLRQAKEEIRAARQQATKEAQAWLTERLAEQSRDHNPKARLLRSFALLDAILLALPAELRAKVGGFAMLARRETDEARLKILRDRIRRADVVVEQFLREEYGKQWDNILERSRPEKDEAGKRRQGRVGALAHAVFPILEMWMAADPAAAQAQADQHLAHSQDDELLEREAAEIGTTVEEREAFHMTLANLLPLVAGWSKAGAEQRAQLVNAAWDFLATNSLAYQRELAVRRERRAWKRAELKGDIGIAGTPAQQQAVRIAAAAPLGDVTNSPIRLYSFEQLLHYAFGENSNVANELAETHRLAEYRKIDAIHADQDAIDSLFHSLTLRPGAPASLRPRRQGSLAGAKLHWALTRPSIDATPLLDAIDSHLRLPHLSPPRVPLSEAHQRTLEAILGKPFAQIADAELEAFALELRPQANYWTRGGPLSALEAVTATMMWRQEDGRRHMEGKYGGPEGETLTKEWGVTQTFVDFLEASLPPAAIAVRDHLTDVYQSEWSLLNPVHRELFGMDMARHHLYSPLTVMPVSGQGSAQVDPETGQPIQTFGITPGWLRNRSATAIARPDFRDALQTFLSHRKGVHHLITHAALAREAQAVITHRDTSDSIRATAGPEALAALAGWIEWFHLGAVRDAGAHSALNRIFARTLGRAATIHLVGKASVLAIQSTQLLAAAGQMPASSYLARFARLLTGQLSWRAAIQSDYIQRRMKTAMPVVQQALESLKARKPTQLRHQVHRLASLIGGADALFTGGTYAILYDYHLRRIAKERPALAGPEVSRLAHTIAARLTDQIAQPLRAGARSIFELQETKPLGRMSWAYSSEARQKVALNLYALATRKRKGGKARLAKTFLVYWLAMGAMATLLRTALRDWRDDEDDEDLFDAKHWGPGRFILGAISGSIYGIPVMGAEFDAAINSLGGGYYPRGTLVSSISEGAGAIGEEALAFTGASEKDSYLRGEKDWDQATRDAEDIFNAAGLLHPGAAAAGAVKNAGKDFWQLLARPLVGAGDE